MKPSSSESNAGGINPPKQFKGIPASQVIRQDLDQKPWYEDPNFTGFITVCGMEKAVACLGRKVAEERAAAASQRSKSLHNTEKSDLEEFTSTLVMDDASSSTNAPHLENFDSGGLTNESQLNDPPSGKSINFPPTPGFSASGSNDGFQGIGTEDSYDSSIEECIELTKEINEYYEVVRFPDLKMEIQRIERELSQTGNFPFIPEELLNEEEFSKKCFEMWANDHLKPDGSKLDMSTENLKLAVDECSYEVKARYCRDPEVSAKLRSWYNDSVPEESES